MLAPLLIGVMGIALAAAGERVKVVFSIDQGFGNGIVVNQDAAAVGRIATALKTLRPRYDVYALLNPQVKDRGKLGAILDLLVAADVPFVFDVYSSDGMTLGTSTPQNAPADGPHGVTISLDDLTKYKHRYGRHLAGLRVMEVFSQDFTVRAIRTTNPEWQGRGWKMPDDEFFQYRLAAPFVRFARDNAMFLQWSDWHWQRFAEWDQPQAGHEKTLGRLLAEFPGVVIVTYANNEPGDKSILRLRNWPEAVEGFVAEGARGYGLSNQSWMRKDEEACPIDDIVGWTKQAMERRCPLIQFEPAWYFFQLPRGSFGLSDYTKDPAWKDAGMPRPAFESLKRVLLAK